MIDTQIAALERLRIATWHDEQARKHRAKAENVIYRDDGEVSTLSEAMSQQRIVKAMWHEASATAIRNLKDE